MKQKNNRYYKENNCSKISEENQCCKKQREEKCCPSSLKEDSERHLCCRRSEEKVYMVVCYDSPVETYIFDTSEEVTKFLEDQVNLEEPENVSQYLEGNFFISYGKEVRVDVQSTHSIRLLGDQNLATKQ